MGVRTLLTRRPIAHRGLHDGNRQRFENSLSAFRAAIDRDYAIELDVQLSADGKAMVFHDEILDRLTSQTGPVAERTASALRAITLGDTGDHVPTLLETLDFIAGRVPVVIEMKDNGERNATLSKAVAHDLAGRDAPIAVMSFSHDLLAAFQATGSPAPLGLTAEGNDAEAFAAHEKALTLGLAFVSYDINALPNAFVTRARAELDLPVITWTVRTPDQVAATQAHADQMTFEGFSP